MTYTPEKMVCRMIVVGNAPEPDSDVSDGKKDSVV